jgi:glyoxylase-like metal-dependent hydrolase (beta-lactamase superfamily II)
VNPESSEKGGPSIGILRRETGPFRVNTYIVYCPFTREAVIIDPAGYTEELVMLIRDRGLRMTRILNTHGHADHVFSNRKFKDAYAITTSMHRDDNRFFQDPAVREATFRETGLPSPDPTDIELSDHDVIPVGRYRIRVIHTPGHTPGSVCFHVDGHLFTGDTLFVGDVGRTDLPGGNLDTLVQSLKTRIVILDRDTVIHPGHDYGETPESTLAREMEENPYITDFVLDA